MEIIQAPNRSARIYWRFPKGFTLVEVLLAIALAAIIMASVYNLFWSIMTLDERTHRLHDQYRQILMADYRLSLDLENAVNLDLSQIYAKGKIFEGKATEFSFLTQTLKGLKHIRYYCGHTRLGPVSAIEIGRVTNPSKPTALGKDDADSLWRQESSLDDWANGTKNNTSIQNIASHLKKGTFHCQYAAPYEKNVQLSSSGGIHYQDSWDKTSLPMSVRCGFIIEDTHNKKGELVFQRDMFLAPFSF